MQEPIPNPEKTVSNPSSPEAAAPATSITSRLRSKKVIIAVLAIVLLLLGAYLFTRKTANKSNTPEYVVATVGGEKIYKSDIQNEAKKQYSENAITEEVLKNTEDKLIEQKILVQEANKLGIEVTEEEVYTSAKGELKDKSNIPDVFLEKARFDLYKWKVKSYLIDSRTAYSIEYWTPDASYVERANFTEDQLAKFKRQQDEGKEALIELEEIVRKGEDEFSAAKDLIIEDEDYTDIKEILAVNGYILKDTQNQVLFKTPRVYTQADRKGLGDRFFDALWALNEGDITLVFSDDYTAGKIFHVVKVANSQYKTYEEWLDIKKKEALSK